MTVKNLRQVVTIGASPAVVYATLVDPKKHAQFSGFPARLVPKPGGRFSHFGTALEGFVLALEKDHRIVLAWRANSWAPGDYSIAEFVLTKVKRGTRVEFLQYGIPSRSFRSIADGWYDHYWGPLQKKFG